MVALGHARADHHEMLFVQHGDGEITRDAPSNRKQWCQTGLADFRRNAVGNNLIEPLGGTFAFNLVLSEVGNIDNANPRAQRPAFFTDVRPPALSLKTIGLLLAHTGRGVPERMFPAIV